MAKDFKEEIEFTLQERTLHEVAKQCWGEFILRESNCEKFNKLKSIEKLVTHREEVVNNLSQIFMSHPNIFPIEIPKKLRDKLVDALICLQQGYIEALYWEKIYKFIIDSTNTILNPLTAGLYSANNFIDPAGHFNDLCWAKRFVADENQFLLSRYTLACFYCFEEAIRDLWHTMKIEAGLTLDLYLTLIKCAADYQTLAVLWAFRLENRLAEIWRENDNYDDAFYINGLKEATWYHYEYAVRFFWTCSSNELRANYFKKFGFKYLIRAAELSQAGLVNFIYSSLSPEQKQSFYSKYSYESEKIALVWCCLIHSQFSQTALNDIFAFPNNAITIKGSWFLKIFTDKMIQLRIPDDIIIFKAVWSHIPKQEQHYVLLKGAPIFKNIGEIKFTNLLKPMVQLLSLTEEEILLLNNWQIACKKMVVKSNKFGDYEVLLRFLLFKVVDCDPYTNKLFLRNGARILRAISYWYDFFKAWTKIQIREKQIELEDVNKIEMGMKLCLQVLRGIIDSRNSCVISY